MTRNARSRTGLAASAALTALALMIFPAPRAFAQAYPGKPVQIIVPFSAGGDADQSARNLAAVAQALIGQPLVVVNKAGANGVLGTQAVKSAVPDGYTLLLARVGSQVILPALQPSTTPYKWNDFTVLGLLDLNPVVCVVASDSRFKTLADLTQALRANPGKLNYSHSGPATVQNLAAQLMLNALGLKPDAAVSIPYKGGSEVALAVAGKEVDFACNNLSSMAGLIGGGRLRALVTTTSARLPQFGDVPTARESGLPALEAVVGWSALVGPPGMSAEAIGRWTSVLEQVGKDPKWIAGNASFGGIPSLLSRKDSEKFIGESSAVYSELVSKTGLTAN